MSISSASIRKNVQVRFDNGRAFNGPKGTSAEAFMLAAAPRTNGRIVASLINGQLRELSEPLNADAHLVPVSMADSDGVRIYRRSLSFLMIAAAADVFPQETITVHHSMPFGGYYCQRDGGRRLNDNELASLRDRMRELVDANLPITRVQVPLDEALQLFRDNGDLEKADLFAKRRKDYLTLYELSGVRDYFHGFMVPSTGYLDLFDLRHYSDGFILQFPRRHEPDRLQEFEDELRLARVFREYDAWLGIVGMPSVAALNRAISAGRGRPSRWF
jgi:uridine kinase